MAKRKKDPIREDRIHNQPIVDAYGTEEQALGWYYYLQNKTRVVDARGGGAQASRERGAGRIAPRRGAVRVAEKHAPARQPVDVRRAHARIAPETPAPVVHVIDRVHQPIRPPRRPLHRGRRRGSP